MCPLRCAIKHLMDAPAQNLVQEGAATAESIRGPVLRTNELMKDRDGLMSKSQRLQIEEVSTSLSQLNELAGIARGCAYLWREEAGIPYPSRKALPSFLRWRPIIGWP